MVLRDFNLVLQEAYSAIEDLRKMQVISAFEHLTHIIDDVSKLRNAWKAST